jgi:hypothetical protein
MSVNPIFVYGVVPSKYTHMEIADMFWHDQIAWVSVVIFDPQNSTPEFNVVYLEISGWKCNSEGRMNALQNYRKMGMFETNMGTFRAVPDWVPSSLKGEGEYKGSYMLFPIDYYIHIGPVETISQATDITQSDFHKYLASAMNEAKAKAKAKARILPEETDELRAKRDIAYAGAFNTKPYYACLSETKTSSEWSTKGLAGQYGYNVDF